MLLSEQVRILEDEAVIDSGASSWSTSTSWTTVKTAAVTLAATMILALYGKTDQNSNYSGNARILLNSVPVLCFGWFSSAIERCVYLVLPAGSYTITYQVCKCDGSSGNGLRFSATSVATLNFPDKQRNNYSGSATVNAGSTVTILDQNFTVPATRKLAVGSIKKYVAIITVDAYCSGYAIDKLLNPGDSNTANWINWTLWVDDAQVSWSERNSDKSVNDYSGSGAYGRYVIALTPNSSHNIKLKAYNGCGSSRDCGVYVEIVLCPWFLADVDYEPVSLDFPQGSTLYVTLEPLHDNTTTKYVRVGRTRFISFGDSTDFYGSSSGTGILSFSYTFEIVEVTNSVLMAKGLGGCISIIGVDFR
jgi:hypothetical protein